MKKYSIITLTSLAFLLGGCAHDPVSEAFEIEENSIEVAVEEITPTMASRENSFAKSGIYNEIIIKYNEDISEKEKYRIRKRYEVISYKDCECADRSLELWRFSTDTNIGGLGEDQNIVDIERRRAQIRTDPELEGGDINFMLNTDTGLTSPDVSIGIPDSKIVSSNSGIGIAILDTGVDYTFKGFEQPFIYNNAASAADDDYGHVNSFGWDIVNQDHDPMDDNGHGTVVTYLITSSIEKQGVDNYHILPVKVADSEGKASFFDLLCGFKYAISRPDISIINLSLGWYGEESEFFAEYLDEARQKKILIVASAGNGATDNGEKPHYPSSYPHDNIISVAAMNKTMSGLASFSNYGQKSVDIAAPGEEIPFEIYNGKYVFAGTSFAAAYATANVGVSRSLGILPGNVESYMTSYMIFSKPLYEKVKTASYIPFTHIRRW